MRQTLEQEKAAATEIAPQLDLSEGLTTIEKVLIALWCTFTSCVFALLYKITKEVDENAQNYQLEDIEEKKQERVQFGQISSNGYEELL